MKKNTGYLFDLIKSLNKSEKRYFRLYANRHVIGKKNSYLELYEALEALEEMKTETFKEDNKGKPFMKHFAYQKNYLYNLILKSMKEYHAGRKSEFRVFELIQQAQFLSDKGLYEQVRKILKKAKILAENYEWFHYMDVILENERRLIKQDAQVERRSRMLEALAESSRNLESLKSRHQALACHDLAFTLVRESHANFAHEEHDPIQPLVAKLEKCNPDTPGTRLIIHNTWNMIYFMSDERQKTLDEYENIIRIWDDNPDWATEFSNRYKTTVSNYLAASFNAGDFSKVPDILGRLDRIPAQSFDEKAEKFQNLYFFRLLYALNSGNRNSGIEMVPEIEKGLKRFRQKINKARLLSFYLNISILFFYELNYSEALKWIQRIIHIKKTEHRKDIQSFALIMELMILWEQDEFENFEIRLRNNRYHLKKYGLESPLNSKIIRAFRHEILHLHTLKEGEGWNDAYIELSHEDSGGVGYLTTLMWLRSKIEQKK